MAFLQDRERPQGQDHLMAGELDHELETLDQMVRL